MPRTQFRPDPQCYIDHYAHQSGGSLPVFRGDVIQQGYGLGGLISGLFRSAFPLIKQAAIPLLKKGATAVGRHFLKTAGSALMRKIDPKKTENRQTIQKRKKKKIHVRASKRPKYSDVFNT